ncbi:MAG TPA: 30S ribosomal protein S21 [Nitrososphaerales archaeon]|nr:30S ribosomal protein S21 [Nitrososphaerales archaeon]
MRVNKKFRNESFESLIKRFRKSCERSNLFLELKDREHFEKPSMSRRLKRKLAIKKEQKRQEDQRINRFPV